MKPLGLSINQVARDLDVPPNRISAIVNGTRSITADTALRLGTYFQVSPETWLGLQIDYDLRLLRQTHGDPDHPEACAPARPPDPRSLGELTANSKTSHWTSAAVSTRATDGRVHQLTNHRWNEEVDGLHNEAHATHRSRDMGARCHC